MVDWFGRAAGFATALLVLLLALLIGVWLLLDRQTQIRRREQEIRDLNDEVRRLQARTPPASAESVAQSAMEEEQQERVLGDWRRALGQLPEPRPTGEPGLSSTEAFFELAAFRSRARRQAEEHGVELDRDEAFGFGSFVTQGPAPEQVDRLMRECRALEQLLALLWDTEPPRTLREVRRNQPAQESPVDRDTFAFAGDPSVRRLGEVSSLGFQLTFVAHTATLRNFLTQVTRLPSPVLVRMITVEPEPVEGFSSGEPEAPSAATESWSRFTVTLEWIEHLAEPGTDNSLMVESRNP